MLNLIWNLWGMKIPISVTAGYGFGRKIIFTMVCITCAYKTRTMILNIVLNLYSIKSYSGDF